MKQKEVKKNCKKNLILTFGVKHQASLSFLVWAENPVILIR